MEPKKLFKRYLVTNSAFIALLGAVPGITFDDAWSKRATLQWQGIEVYVVGFDDLCEAKRAAGRPKDLADLRTLEKFRP